MISSVQLYKPCVTRLLQLSTGSDDADRLGLIVGLSVGIFVALAFVIGELFSAYTTFTYYAMIYGTATVKITLLR